MWCDVGVGISLCHVVRCRRGYRSTVCGVVEAWVYIYGMGCGVGEGMGLWYVGWCWCGYRSMVCVAV